MTTINNETHGGVIVAAQESWDSVREGWTNRRVARKFADQFIRDGLSPKSVVVDKDGNMVRLYFPALGGMWRPVDGSPLAWLQEYTRIIEQYQQGDE